jgi:hypothetical protein
MVAVDATDVDIVAAFAHMAHRFLRRNKQILDVDATLLREPPVTNTTFPMRVFDIVFFPFGSFRRYRPDGS